MRTWLERIVRAAGAAAVAAAFAAPAYAVDLTFYYPVAVGGPVTKIVDGLAVRTA